MRDDQSYRVEVPAVLAAGLLLIMMLGLAGPAGAQEGVPPSISDVETYDVTPDSARVTWTVDRPATGQVEYGTSERYGAFTELEPSFDYSTHIQQITDLVPGTTYYFRIISVDQADQEVVSEGHSFTTLAISTPDPGAGPSTDIYGSAVNVDSLNNSVVGGESRNEVAYRFRATETARLESITVYIETGPGYSDGDGGILRITLREDDGTSRHWPAATVLAERVVRPGGGAGNVYRFPSPPRLVEGRLYHVVFANIDDAPTRNYVSLNGLFVFDEQQRWQPFTTNTDWAQLVSVDGSGWTGFRGEGRGTITPIMALDYANGYQAGLGYMEVWVGAPKTISGSRMVRERFTVNTVDRLVSSVSVRLRRVSGDGALGVRLEDASGDALWSGSIPASSLDLSDQPPGRGASWATVAFEEPLTLQAAQEYHLVLSADADTEYSIFSVRKGVSHGYGPKTYFELGHAEYDDGTGWVAFDPGWRGPLDESDLQFYFE